MYGEQYVRALMDGDRETAEAIERLNRDEYPTNREGFLQKESDDWKAFWGKSSSEGYW